jgi:integrase
MNFETVANQYLQELETGSNPVRPSTLSAYRSEIRCHLSRFNHLEMEAIATQNNKLLRQLVADLRPTYKPASIRSTVTLFKQIVDSLVDDNGVPRFRCVWNNDFIALPAVNPAEQNAPIIPIEELQSAVTSHKDRLLFGLLAGTGLRIGEALALTGDCWDRGAGILTIRASKTAAGVREVDLPWALNTWLQEGLAAGKPVSRLFPGSIMGYRQRAEGITGFAHGFRRFRLTHLRRVGAPEDLLRFWLGHSDKTISDRYSRIRCDREFRREQAERAGLGFHLPPHATNDVAPPIFQHATL